MLIRKADAADGAARRLLPLLEDVLRHRDRETAGLLALSEMRKRLRALHCDPLPTAEGIDLAVLVTEKQRDRVWVKLTELYAPYCIRWLRMRHLATEIQDLARTGLDGQGQRAWKGAAEARTLGNRIDEYSRVLNSVSVA